MRAERWLDGVRHGIKPAISFGCDYCATARRKRDCAPVSADAPLSRAVNWLTLTVIALVRVLRFPAFPDGRTVHAALSGRAPILRACPRSLCRTGPGAGPAIYLARCAVSG